MAQLVDLTKLKSYLGVTDAASDTLLGDLTTRVQQIFERACGREERPFADAQSGRTEIRDGTGTAPIYLDYKPTAITSITLGTNPSTPDETITPSDLTKVTWGTDSRRVARVDGGTFGAFDAPRYVKVVYDAAADLPEAATAAVMAGIAYVWRRRGSEEAATERIGAYETQLLNDLSTNMIAEPTWSTGLTLCAEPRI